MRISNTLSRCIAALVAAGFAGHLIPVQAADVWINSFDAASSVAGWRFDYGSDPAKATVAFSPGDALGSASSGSLALSAEFNPTLFQAAFTANFSAPVRATGYSSLEFDVRVDAASSADRFGNAVYFQLALRNGAGFEYNKVFQDNVAVVSTNGGWRHVVVAPIAGAIDDLRAITLDLYDGNYTNAGTAKVYVDNLKFTQPAPTVDVPVVQFNDPAEADRWRFDYGSPDIQNALAFSPDDADGRTDSGSLELQITYGPGAPQAAFTMNLPAAVDASTYSTLEMDVKVDPASALDAFGNATFFQVALRVGAGFSYSKQFQDTVRVVSTNNGWRHLVAGPLTGIVDDIRGITLDPYDGDYATLGSPTILRVDNVKFTRPATLQPPPAPKLALEAAVPGLNLIPLGTFNRESIATHGEQLGWIGSSEPVRYALTISDYPDASHAGFQTHIFLDAAGDAGPDTYADYNRPNVIFLDLQNQADGSVFAAFRYKTNEPQKNAFLFGAGTLGGVAAPSALGTWTLTFDHDTNVTVTAPGGAIFATNLPPAAASLFKGALNVSVGAQANNNQAIGETVVIQRFQVSRGPTVVLDSDFSRTTELEGGPWQLAAVDTSSVRPVGADSVYWVAWTLPDAGFRLQTTAQFQTPTIWVDSAVAAVSYGGSRRALVKASDLPDGARGYFRLRQDPPTESASGR